MANGRHFMTRPFFGSCLSCVFLSLFCGTSFGGRIVKIEVRVDGEVVLEREDGDYGDRDADAVWESLKEVNLRETDAFKTLKIAPDQKKFNIQRENPKKGPLPIEIHVMYGGIAHTCNMTIERVTPDRFGGKWRIVRDDVDDLFDARMISRSDATTLRDPKFDKIAARIKEKAASKVKESR